ncbi:DNA-binding HTH domain-containing protein [Simiduia agarivorans]|uniref:DNA-binding HTH domain-containing protein n=1 Tax=Simiduia agarivorans (strain DSM 21679 / JCM 13881 / BCRC 17597 / SA1) TaxID=1117647 RepID=K4L062_SIMAS|nr:DNA-binding HTH domain-containing protein [Simiduia agarivorans]AFU99562.1 DNA-binding HTH domain-containing protein [Simiduia agarivorans SA1 = DSM 21679]
MNKDVDFPLEAIYECVASPEKYTSVLAALSEVLGSSHAFVAMRSGVDDSPVGFFQSGFDEGYFERYQAHFYQVDLWTHGLARYKFNEFHPSHIVCNDKAFLNSEIYTDFAQPAGIRHSIGQLNVENDQNLITEIAFMRGKDRQHYAGDQVKTANFFSRHLLHALALSNRLLSYQAMSHNLACIVDQLAEPAFICNRDGQVQYANEAANRFFRRCPWFTEAGGSIRIFDSSLRALFLNGLQHICDSHIIGSKTELERSFQQDGSHYQLSFSALPYSTVMSWGRSTSISCLIKLKIMQHERQISPGQIAEVFGLTESEATTVAYLCNGLSPEDISEKRALKISSVRQQIKAALQKTDTGSQAQLVSKVLRLLL